MSEIKMAWNKIFSDKILFFLEMKAIFNLKTNLEIAENTDLDRNWIEPITRLNGVFVPILFNQGSYVRY